MKASLSLISLRVHRQMVLLVGVLLSLSSIVGAQRNAIRFQLDNDWLTDQYYSAGIEVTYYRSIAELPLLAKTKQHKDRSFSWTAAYGFKIFTPNVYDEESFSTMTQDRPFAGYQYLSAGLQKISKDNTFQSYGLSIGEVGPRAGMEKIQRAAHIAVGYEPIFGWENQIVNEVVVDFRYQWIKEWRIDPVIGISVHNALQAGTANNFLQTGAHFRIGAFEAISQSGWLKPFTRYQEQASTAKQSEFFIIAGFRTKYVVSNIFLEGSLFDNPSPVMIDPRQWFLETELGMMLMTKKLSLGIIGIFQGREFAGADGHFYINFNIAYAF